MKAMKKFVLIGMAVWLWSAVGSATELTIHLSGSGAITRSTMRFECDSQGSKMGLPPGVFSVEYLNGAGNSLAIVPVQGKSLIFANVASGSGARYAAGEYIWWDAAGRAVTLASDSIAGKMSSTCHRVQ
jgi:membrane-bound inhibitor of C-type lysozyme